MESKYSSKLTKKELDLINNLLKSVEKRGGDEKGLLIDPQLMPATITAYMKAAAYMLLAAGALLGAKAPLPEEEAVFAAIKKKLGGEVKLKDILKAREEIISNDKLNE